MKVRYLGHSCFEFTSKNGVKVITDPYTRVGYELPNGLSADILTVSHAHFDHNYAKAVNTDYIVNEIGEYSICGVDFCGIPSFHDPKMGALRGTNVIYKIEMDGITLCHMGDIGEECSDELVKKIGNVDVLFIPVGGVYTVDALGAKKYVERLRPKAVVPMHYKPEDGALDIAGIELFIDLYPQQQVKHVENGVGDIDGQSQGIIYMERVKNI